MQYKYNLIITLLCLYLGLALGSFNVQAYASREFTAQRGLFLQVESDIKKGKIQSYSKHKQALLNYPLYPYLKFELLKKAIKSVKHAEISAFVKTYYDSPLANKLRNEWLKEKAKNKLWHDYLLAYDPTADNEVDLQCHYINATLNTAKDKLIHEALYNQVTQIWLTGGPLPKACDPVLQSWQHAGKMTRHLLWQRIKLSIVAGENRLARHLAKMLPNHEDKIVELWIRTSNDPSLIAKPHYYTARHSAISEMIIMAIIKIAKSKPQDAVKLWQTLDKNHHFNEHHWGLVVKEVGLSLARKLDPNAEKWLIVVPAEFTGKDVYDARLKVAINNNDWGNIAKIYLTLPDEESNTEKWQYWYARSLEMLGDRTASQDILFTLSQGRSYYRFLASARILKPFNFNIEQTQMPQESLNNILLKPAIIRAHELKQIGRVHVGRTEWSKALESMDDTQRLAAAHLANDWEVPNWAIVALSKAANKNDLILRFPKNFADYIHREAKNHDLDPEVIFAITRQESAFIPTARSPVGALGLMQLMPKTGKELAKLSHEPIKHYSDLLKPEKNIRLGSKYIRMILDQHQQNHVLAAAAYNAGPHRVIKWLPEYDMPADSWIETIPFKETREYVQNVLTYTVIYQQILGKTPKMHKFMPIINGSKRSKQL